MEKTVKERIKEFMNEMNLKITHFESICGLSNGYLRNLKNNPGADKVAKILSAFPNLNSEWLLYGEGTMLNAPSPSPGISQHNIHGSNNYVDMGSSVGGMAFCPQCGRTEPFAEAEEIPVAAPIVPTQLTTAPDTDVLEAVARDKGFVKAGEKLFVDVAN